MNDTPFVINIDGIESFQANVIELSAQVPVVVDFWADWCQPCQILIPILTKLANDSQGEFILAKVNSDEHQELAAQAGVRSLPTVMIFKDGQVVDSFTGAKPESEVKQIIDKHINADPVAEAINNAFELFKRGEEEQAFDALKSLNAAYPENFKVHYAIAELYLESEKYQLCQELIAALPANIQQESEVKSIKSRLEVAMAAADAPEITELEKQIAEQPDNLDIRYQLANVQIAKQDFENALDNLIQILQKDRNYNDNAARAAMLKVFEILGGQGDIVRRYRSKLFSLLN